ncbi:MAG TPA: ASPIC/UnbV domain-containing protein, partial [Candidatus Polarisedimenticolia bacterium]|nr:ASPIC/UnbV domain-containing protein [Candidatus Polarisedimenticolia bacterium]
RGGGRWLTIKLRGVRSNRDGVGARVRVMTRDAGGAERWQADEVRAGSSYLSQNDLRLHFGLGKAEAAEIVEVRWPSGIVQRLGKTLAVRIVTIEESGDPPRKQTPRESAGF